MAPSVHESATVVVPVGVAVSPLGAPVTGADAGRQYCIIAPMSRRPPLTVRPLRDAVGAAEATSALRMAAPVLVGSIEAHKAAAPVTCGVAMEVPL